MLSSIPLNLSKVKKENIDKEILRVGMIAELDAVSLYEQLAAITDNKKLKETFLDIAKEEKTHVGEFQALLLKLDKEQEEELKAGKKEVEKWVVQLADAKLKRKNQKRRNNYSIFFGKGLLIVIGIISFSNSLLAISIGL